jgi:hypothetical protein
MIKRSLFAPKFEYGWLYASRKSVHHTRFGLLLIAAQLADESAHAQQIQSIDELAPVRVEERPHGEQLVGPYNLKSSFRLRRARLAFE